MKQLFNMETKQPKVSVQDKILQRIMNKCWYEDDGSAAVYYEIVESAVTQEVSELAKERDDLLEALIELKASMDETIKWTNGGLKSLSILEQDRYKTICNAINKATK